LSKLKTIARGKIKDVFRLPECESEGITLLKNICKYLLADMA
jgi:hypothetical protein